MFNSTRIITIYLLLSAWPCFATITQDQVHFQVFTNRSVVEGLALLNNEKTLWVSTNGGLEQRDGRTGQLINVFTHVKTLPVSDGQDGQWGINRHGNLVHLSDTGEWQVYTKDNSGLPDSPVGSLVSEGQLLWLGTQRGLVRWQNPQTVTVFDMNNSPLPDNFLRVLLADGSGGVWLETRNGDYVHLSGDQQWTVVPTTEPRLPSSPITTFTGDDNSGIWFASEDSEKPLTHLTRTGQLTTHNPLSESETTYFMEGMPLLSDSQGGLWVGLLLSGTSGNLVRYLNVQGEWISYPFIKEEWLYENATVLAKDNQGGGLWVGTDYFFRYLTPQGEWQEISFERGEYLNVTALASDTQGGVWIGTQNNYYGQSSGGLAHLNSQREWQFFDSGLPNTYITHFISDGIGGIWIDLPGGFAHLSQSEEWTLNSSVPTDLYYLEYLVNDGNGGICLGETTRHIHVTDTQVKVFNSQDQLPSTCLTNLTLPTSRNYISDGRGGIWEKIYNGLAHQNSQGQRQVFNLTNSPLPSSQINAIVGDGEGGVWVACGEGNGEAESTLGGLVHVSSDYQWMVFSSTNSNLPTNYVEDLVSDELGGAWVKTYDGLAHRLAHLSVQPTFSLPPLGTGVSKGKNPSETPPTSVFAGGASVNSQSYQVQTSPTQSDLVVVKGEIQVDPTHQGQIAEMIVYAKVDLGGQRLFVMLDNTGNLQVWDEQVENLVAFKENVMLQAKQPLSIYRGSFSTAGSKQVLFGYRLPDGKVIMSPVAVDINVLEWPLLGTGRGIDANQQAFVTTTTFAGGIAVNGQAYQTQVTQHLADAVQIAGEITVDAAHVGQVVDLVVYAETGSPLAPTPVYFMLGENLNILPWDQNVVHLVPFQRQVTLNARQPVTIYSGKFFYPGTLKVFFGYRLGDGRTVVNEQGMGVTILE